MANKTAAGSISIHGKDPQNLVEQIVRQRIYNNMYWKEHCFGLRTDDVLEKAVKIEAVGGTYGGYRKPSKFLCLVLKLLQLQPEIEAIHELIAQDDFKYVRILAAFYVRLVATPVQIYQTLEPLFEDYRKIRLRNIDGSYTITYVDEVIDRMLTEEVMFDTTLPRIPSRHLLEKNEILQPLLRETTGVADSDDDDSDDDDAAPTPAAHTGSAPPAHYPPLPSMPPPPGLPGASNKRKRSESPEDLDEID